MRGGTLFSGIGAPECSAPFIDWRWAAEIEPFPSAVHAARFPGVINLGDVTKVRWEGVDAVDVVVAGSPCQSFSVAGKRLGMDGGAARPRPLAIDLYCGRAIRCIVFENVAEAASKRHRWKEIRIVNGHLSRRKDKGCPWRPRSLALSVRVR